jgi:1-deoxy-D-xylulose-5-phosphate reductoisomerase
VRRHDSQRPLPARCIVLLGSTGSIGRQALEICASRTDLAVVGLVADRRYEAVLDQASRLGTPAVGLHDLDAAAAAARQGSGCRVVAGDAGIADLIAAAAGDAAAAGAELVVLNGIVGAAGLRASLAALEAGATLALANKESMVTGGPFVLRAARRSRGDVRIGSTAIVPVDSEHSAIFQCLEAGRSGAGRAGIESGEDPLLTAEEILLTGSGGPFRGSTRGDLLVANAERALQHPNWVMGPKVTIDSDTLMNKGLEVIEAHYLFGVPYEKISVVVHPESIVHSLVRYADGAVLAHLGAPDMRTPIGYALTYPRRMPMPMVTPLDLAARSLTFEPPDDESFGCLKLARQAGEMAARAWDPAASGHCGAAGVEATDGGGGGEGAVAGGPGAAAPIALNAANEVAVAAFLDGRIGFLDIERLVEHTLEVLADEPIGTLDDVFAIDAEARLIAGGAIHSG